VSHLGAAGSTTVYFFRRFGTSSIFSTGSSAWTRSIRKYSLHVSCAQAKQLRSCARLLQRELQFQFVSIYLTTILRQELAWTARFCRVTSSLQRHNDTGHKKVTASITKHGRLQRVRSKSFTGYRKVVNSMKTATELGIDASATLNKHNHRHGPNSWSVEQGRIWREFYERYYKVLHKWCCETSKRFHNVGMGRSRIIVEWMSECGIVLSVVNQLFIIGLSVVYQILIVIGGFPRGSCIEFWQVSSRGSCVQNPCGSCIEFWQLTGVWDCVISRANNFLT